MKTGWVTKRLGEVCESVLGKMLDRQKNTGRPEKYLRNINVRWGEFDLSDLYEMGFEEDEQERYGLKPGDLVMCEGGEPGRCAVWTDGPVTMKFQKALHRIRCNSEIDPYYLYYYFRFMSCNGELQAYFDGRDATIKHLTGQLLRQVKVTFPPLPEQRRIVAKIDAAFEKIDRLKANAERNLANAKELFQSTLNEAMRPKPGWVEKRLGEVCSKIGSGATPKGGRKSYCSSGVSLIRSMNVYDHAFKYDELAHINESQAHELDNVEISKNDVLINITGASIARCCVVPADVLPARVNQHVSILRISDDTEVAADFLCYRLISFEAKEALLKIGEAGSTRQALTKGDLESFVVSLPGLGVQKKIIDAIAAAEKSYLKLQSNYTRLIADCAEMRQAVLKEAFEGRL